MQNSTMADDIPLSNDTTVVFLEPHPQERSQEKYHIMIVYTSSVTCILFVLVTLALMRRVFKRIYDHGKETSSTYQEGKLQPLDERTPPVTFQSYYFEPASKPFPKLMTGSAKGQEHLDFLPPCKQSYTICHVEGGSMIERKRYGGHVRNNSASSDSSSVSDISRMMWNISNLPENVDPKMVACQLVDHNGGKLTIGDTGVSLTIPPHAIPEGRTEGIFIAIMNQEKEHPRVTSNGPLLSPVVECGPNGLKFDRHVIISMPHCALLEEGSWNLKVQCNESEPEKPAVWNELIDVNKQDGSEPYLAVVDSNVIHFMVDHFTGFAVTGEPACRGQTKKAVRIVAYVTPPEADGDCMARVYCVGDTRAHLECVHNQESALGGIVKDAPKPFHLRDGGADIVVQLINHHPGWKNVSGDHKKIRFEHIWEGVERMPCCTFVFSLAGESVSQFRAAFVVKQNCEDGDEQEVHIVTTKIKDSQVTANDRGYGESTASADPPKEAHTTNDVLNADSITCSNSAQSSPRGNVACPGNPWESPTHTRETSSGYSSSSVFEPLKYIDSLTLRGRDELIIVLDPPHPTANWKHLAEELGLKMRHIRWLDNRKPPASPTDSLLTMMESQKYPLNKLAETLRKLGRDDAAKIIEDHLMLRETSV